MFSQMNVKVWFMAIVIFYAITLSGCSSTFKTVMPEPRVHYQKVGKAEGTACGSLLFGIPVYNFIPIVLNGRVERAYDNALESVPGATSLTNVTMQEFWFWWAIGTTKCVTITGDAIR